MELDRLNEVRSLVRLGVLLLAKDLQFLLFDVEFFDEGEMLHLKRVDFVLQFPRLLLAFLTTVHQLFTDLLRFSLCDYSGSTFPSNLSIDVHNLLRKVLDRFILRLGFLFETE